MVDIGIDTTGVQSVISILPSVTCGQSDSWRFICAAGDAAIVIVVVWSSGTEGLSLAGITESMIVSVGEDDT